MEQLGPLEIVDRVVVAGGEPRCHRAWPAAEVAANGDLLVAYKEGSTHHRVDDEAAFVARSPDSGRTWPARKAIAALPGRGYWTAHGLTRLAGGDLLLRLDYGWHGPPGPDSRAGRVRRTVVTRSVDHGALWQECSPTVDLPPLDPIFCVSYCRTDELPDGRLLAPFYGIPRGAADLSARSVVAAFSSDGGRTWPDHAVVHDHVQDPSLCCSETDLLRLVDGRHLVVSRANARRELYRAFSEDLGRTWSRLEPTGLPGQCPALIALPSGAVLCLYRDVTPGRFGVGAGISRDGGRTWEALGHLYRGPNADCAYPSPVLLSDGTVFTPYYTSAEPEASTGTCEIHGVFLRERTG